ncbi:MAG TPA: replication factor C large subunit [Candidatus Nanoarchaeia archaeon]|nr:replication factor C large subunit [Candidatus Nanoarchaeia archaeon]
MLPWIKKYQPKTAAEIVGQESQVAFVSQYIQQHARQKRKGLLLYGPSGIGKTALCHALAHDLGYELFEINASDVRNREEIETRVGAVIHQQSLFCTGKVILIDEVDGLSHDDRGGLPALVQLIRQSGFPMLLTITNPWDSKYSSLRSCCEMIEFREVSPAALFPILKRICDAERISYHAEVLQALARRSGGDVRSAINDLQVLSSGGSITRESLDELGDRHKTESIKQALVKVLKTTDITIARDAFAHVEEDGDKILLWIDENLPKEYTKPADLAAAYDSLSKADVFSRRIRRWQHWRFMVYVDALMTSGVAAAKQQRYPAFVQYTPTTRLLAIWRANMKYLKRKAIAEKLADATHTSFRDAVQHIPYLKAWAVPAQQRRAITAELDLNQEEAAWLQH